MATFTTTKPNLNTGKGPIAQPPPPTPKPTGPTIFKPTPITKTTIIRGTGRSSGRGSSSGSSSRTSPPTPTPTPTIEIKPELPPPTETKPSLTPTQRLTESLTKPLPTIPGTLLQGNLPQSTIKPLTQTQTTARFTTTRPTGQKIQTETTKTLLQKGALGSALRLEEQTTQPFTNQGLDIAEGIKKLGLGIASIPAEFGQLIGSNIAKIIDKPTKFKEDQEFFYTSQKGEKTIQEIYSPQKSLTQTQKGFQEKPLETGIDITLKTLGLIPLATATTKIVSRGFTKAGTLFAQYIPAEKIISKEVLKGTTKFPYVKNIKEATQITKSGKFNIVKDQPIVYHATTSSNIPIIGRKTIITAGRGLEKTSDVPGLYTGTKGVSPYFLRLKKQIGLDYSLPKKILPKIIPDQPKIKAIQQAPQRIPKEFRTTLAKGQEFFGKTPATKTTKQIIQAKQAKSGIPYYSPALEKGIKKEAEAVISVGTKTIRTGLTTIPQKITGFAKYTKINGKVIPIYEEKTIVEASKPIVKGLTKVIKTVQPKTIITSSSSVSGSSKSLLSSGNVLVGSRLISYIKPTNSQKIVSKTYSPIKPNNYSYFKNFARPDYSVFTKSYSKTTPSVSEGGVIKPISRTPIRVSSGGGSSSGSSPSVVTSSSVSSVPSKIISSSSTSTPSSVTSFPSKKVPPFKPTNIDDKSSSKTMNGKKFKLTNRTQLKKFWSQKPKKNKLI